MAAQTDLICLIRGTYLSKTGRNFGLEANRRIEETKSRHRSHRMVNVSKETKTHYDFIVVGAGPAGSGFAGGFSPSRAPGLVFESGGVADAPTITKPNIWFYNVGGAPGYRLPLPPF